MSKFIEWLKTPLTERWSSTSPAAIILLVTAMMLVRNVPLGENTIDLNDLWFWVRTNATIILVCWGSSVIAKKNVEKEN